MMDVTEAFTFRNVSFSNSNYSVLYEKLYYYFLVGKFTDVTITSCMEERVFRCHKLILAAACEHFDKMFSGNWRESREKTINFPDLNGMALELFVQFAYRGVINLDDENVYAALCVSDRFGLPTLEHLCVRYLTERSIPTDYVTDLFVFANATNKTLLIPRLRDFILNNLQKLWKDAGENVLLRMNLDDLKALLTNHRPLPFEKEIDLCKALVHWVSETYPRQMAVLQELLSICQFVLCRVEPNYIERLFESDDRGVHVWPCPIKIKSKQWLHLYVMNKTRHYSLLTMEAHDDDAIYFHQPVQVALNDYCRIKTLTMGDQLYLYALRPDIYHDNFDMIFSAYSSVSFTDKQLLRTPGNLWKFTICRVRGVRRAFDDASISGDPVRRQIYLLQSLYPQMEKELFMYNCETDMWFPKDYKSQGIEMEVISYFDHRVYAFGSNKVVHALDYRAGKWEKLRNCGLLHRDSDRFCDHRRKLYATGMREQVNQCKRSHVELEVYDPVADRWRELSLPFIPSEEILSSKWLVSLESKLWLFGTSYDCNHRFQRYDSFLDMWETSCHRVFRYPDKEEEEGKIKSIVVSGCE